MGDDMQVGAYESLHTTALDAALSGTPFTARYAAVTAASAPGVLARHVTSTLTRALSSISDPAEQISTVNGLLTRLTSSADPVVALEQLITLTEEVASGAHRLIPEPTIKLSDVALLTNAKDQPNLGAALSSELGSADRVDLLCAFIRYSGIRVIRDQLRQLGDHGVPFRVLTTTYMGATERRAIDYLVRELGADVKISYNARSTRLHAKAWLFHRSSGFDTGFIGSSNLSHAAMVDGLEWNVRISSVATPTLVRQFSAAFDTYWNDDAFVSYDPDVDGDRLEAALAEAHGSGVRRPVDIANPAIPQEVPAEAPPAGAAGVVPRLTVVRTPNGPLVRPYPHQEQMLEALDVERTIHDRHRNLLVAATGTGKTVVAALDYLRLCERSGTRPTLLFVAHRREILQQSIRTYRDVLGDASFGEEFVDGARPTQWRHVFASIQGLAGLDLDPTQFAVVVVDEFHHAEAPTYQRLLDTLRPTELLGLTATPERTDGVDVRSFFEGRTAHELRLWDALEQDLLCPFHYYGIADGTDLRDVEWTRGAYDVAGLSEVYTGNDARARVVITALRDTVNDPSSIRALGFCVSVAHAEYMARVFTEAGLPALAVSAGTSREDRDAAFAALRAGAVRCLFAVDLFNEGLDLPDVDTLLLLRPTQSATVFLQQLGRGLRRTHDKALLTVLDFIGQQRREFRFDVRFRALTGGTRSELERDIQAGFPFLPSGCRIVLDRVAQQTVLGNVRAALSLNQRREMVSDVRAHGEATLAEYLRASGHELADVYRNGSWTGLRRSASLVSTPPGPAEATLLKRMSALAHVDDPERAEVYRLLTGPTAPSYESLHPRWQHLARMLFFALWPNKGGHESFDAGLATLRDNPAIGDEVSQLMDVALERIHHVPQALSPALAHLPILSHATYRREELLAGINWATWDRSARGNITGVAWSETERVDALMINLHKDDAGFSPTTMYRDYPISRDLFHWESQNATSTASPAGRRYTDGSANTVLFVRDRPTDEMGAAPFLCLGAADHVEHQGEKPIAITWKLHRPMPVEVLQSAAVVAS